MKNILLLSTIYPAPDLHNGTPVCHYFASHWVEMGYNVKVVHVQAIYPRPLYWLASMFEERIKTKTGAVVYTKRDIGIHHYEMDGVDIMRVALYKPIPHGPHPASKVSYLVNSIVEYNKSCSFVPDVIVGHFHNPILETVSRLKHIYGNVRTSIVMHDAGNRIVKTYPKQYEILMKDIDVWGFRSEVFRREFENNFGKRDNSFICYSGVPAKFIVEQNGRCFDKPLSKYIYIGEFIARKYPASIIKPIVTKSASTLDRIVFVGNGAERSNIERVANECHIVDKILFTGKIPREQINDYLDESECFIMITKSEAFGLVYLEAMARGCIVIGSRNEGIDGVIVDGVNGFLCEAGNSDELDAIIGRINEMSPEERMRISKAGLATARMMTDERVAELYINALIS